MISIVHIMPCSPPNDNFMPSNLSPDLDFDFQIATVKGKKLNTASFNQLYQQQPYGENYELLFDILGRVYKTKNFVVFNTSDGVRRFDITYFMRKEREHALDESIYSCLSPRISPYMELDKFSFKVKSYYQQLLSDGGEDRYHDYLYCLIYEEHSNHQREDIIGMLLSELKGDFKTDLDTAYQLGLQKKRNFNKLVDAFISSPQIFI